MSHAFRSTRSRTASASRLLLWTTLLVATLGYGASVAWAGVEPAARDAAPAARSLSLSAADAPRP